MNNLNQLFFKSARLIVCKLSSREINYPSIKYIALKEYASKLIYDILNQENPCMIARLGAVEATALCNYIGVKNKTSWVDYIKGQTPPWWWDNSVKYIMSNNAGFFPTTDEMLNKFGELMMSDISLIDILGSWCPQEILFQKYWDNTKYIDMVDLNPFFETKPWTRILENKKVLVISPFEKSIKKQYEIIDKVFPDGIMPQFELKTIKAVQSIANNRVPFDSWFAALEWMESEIDKIDFDIALIGCGAYGLPLAAYVKRIGKKAVHLGGTLQLMFGIRCSRFDNIYEPYPWHNLYNEYWVYPDLDETPKNIEKVENGCYWK